MFNEKNKIDIAYTPCCRRTSTYGISTCFLTIIDLAYLLFYMDRCTAECIVQPSLLRAMARHASKVPESPSQLQEAGVQ